MNRKELRLKVLNKYNGHCAYCGCEITLADMQIDHIIPRKSFEDKKQAVDDSIDNYNPSCRLCNHYKRAESIEVFRDWSLGGVIDRLKKIYIFRVALKYHMIEIKGWNHKFYFEQFKKK